MNHEVLVLNLDWHPRPVTADCVEKSFAHLEVERISKFVRTRNDAGFNACRKVARVMPAKTAPPERAEQILQRFEAQEVDRFVGDFKAHLRLIAVHRLAHRSARRRLIRWSNLRWLLGIN